MRKPFFYAETEGIRVIVRPLYLADSSEPARDRFVFAYFVRIENIGSLAAQLLSRRWLIIDSAADPYEVVGDGVVGEQPLLARGAVHEYNSFCVLRSPYGTMEGSYRFIRSDDTMFEAAIPRFVLDASDGV